MNIKFGISILFIASFCMCLSSGSLAQTPAVPLNLSVEVSKTTKDKEKHGTPTPANAPGAEDRLLEITVKNPGGVALANVEVKYWLMVRDVKTRDISIGVNDTSTLTLAPYSEQVVTSSVAKCDYTPRSGSGKANAAKGNKFYGYGVQVVEGGKVVTQEYDPDDVKTEIEGGGKK